MKIPTQLTLKTLVHYMHCLIFVIFWVFSACFSFPFSLLLNFECVTCVHFYIKQIK